MYLIRTIFVSLIIAAPTAVLALCTAEGAYGIAFGQKVGFFASRAHEPGMLSPYLTAYAMKPPQPDPRFDSYLVRVENDAKVIYVVTALQKLFTAESSTMPGDEYRARVYPVLEKIAAQISQEQGVQLKTKYGGYYTALTPDVSLELSAELEGTNVYAVFKCLSVRLNNDASKAAITKYLACVGDGKTYKPECSQGVPR